jgi:hypothetical protein
MFTKMLCHLGFLTPLKRERGEIQKDVKIMPEVEAGGGMDSIKEFIREGPVHSRNIEIRTFPAEQERVVVEGRLNDERFVCGTRWDGETEAPRTVHRIVVRLLVGDWPPTILDAEAEMLDVPHTLCPMTLDSIRNVVGVTITPGYGKEVQERLGGVRGCTHMAHLVGAMGIAVLHGVWTERSRHPRTPPESLEAIPGFSQLKDSCLLWREGGPIIEEMRARLKALHNENSQRGE